MKLNELLPDNDSFERMADALEAIVNQRKPLAAPANDNKPKLLQVPDAVKADLKERFQITWFDDVDKMIRRRRRKKSFRRTWRWLVFFVRGQTRHG